MRLAGTVQASFSSTDTIGDVRALVARVVAPALRPALYLFTTPPRTLLKDDSLTLYKAQLVPAAHIHVGLDETKGGRRQAITLGSRGGGL